MYKYEELARGIKTKILSSELQPQQKLPNVRELAQIADCSIGTVVKTYELLQKQRFIYQKKHSGFYVSDHSLWWSEAKENESYQLTSGNPTSELLADLELFENFEVAGHYYQKYSRDMPIRGSRSLIECLPKFLEELGIYVKPENIFLSLGILHVVTILAEMPFPNQGQAILIEEPTYTYVLEFLQQTNLTVQRIPRTTKGLDLTQLEEIFQTGTIKFFYVVPRNHNPYGTYLSYQQRKKIMALGEKYDVYIVEDDYLGGYDDLPRYEPLFYHDNFSHGIYLYSFSKILPMVRIGVAILPEALLKDYEQAIQRNSRRTYYTPSLLAQAILENYLRSSAYIRHRLFFKERTRKKIEQIQLATKNWQQKGFTYQPPASGFYSSVILEPQIDLEGLLWRLNKRKIFVKSNSSAFYEPENFNNSFRLSHAKIGLQDIQPIYGIIYEELQQAVLRSK